MDEIEKQIVARHSQTLGWLLSGAQGLYRARLIAALEGEAVHMGQLVLLASLYVHNDLTQAQLSKVSGIEKSSVVLFLDALEKAGWVERRPHPGDRRAHLVHLTDDGRARFEPLGLKMKAVQDDALSVFSDAERATFEGYLLRLIGHLNPSDG